MMRLQLVAWLRGTATAALIAGPALWPGCVCEFPDPPLFPCGAAPVVDRPIGDPCRVGRVVLSRQFDRDHGMPREEAAPFTTSGGEVCLTVQNGDGESRVSSARIALDSVEIFHPFNFNPHVDRLERRTTLDVGTHSVSVRVASAPGSFVIVEVRAIEPFAPERVASVSALATLREATCLEARLGASQLTPEQFTQASRTATDFGLVLGQLVVLTSEWGTPSLLQPLPGETLVGTNSAERAASWIARHRDLFELEDPSVTFAIGTAIDDGDGNETVGLNELWQGLRVVPASASLVLQTSTGRPLSFSGHLVPARELPTELVPGITAEQATTLGRAAVAAPIDARAGAALIVFAVTGLASRYTELAYEVPVFPEIGSASIVYLRASDGVELDRSTATQEFIAASRIDKATTVACSSTGDETVEARETIENTATPPFDRSCDGDTRCEDARLYIEDIETRLLTMGRNGWSGGGVAETVPVLGDLVIPPIPPHAPYKITYGIGEFTGEWDQVNAEVLVGRSMLSRDVLSHETGHGIHQVSRRNAPILATWYFATQRAISESIGDSLGLVIRQSIDPISELSLDDADGVSLCDYAIETCDGYGPGSTCDLRITTGASACGTVTQVRGCAEYTHLDFFADHRTEPESVNPRLEPHFLGCALLRPLTYALQAGPRFVHGVWIDQINPDAAAIAFRYVYPRITSDTVTADEYGEALWTGAIKLDEFCRLNPDQSACTDARPGGWFGQGIWAAGYWSAPHDILGAHETLPGDYVAATGIGATTYTPLSGMVLVIVFGDASGALRYAELPGAFPREVGGALVPYPTPGVFTGVTTRDDPSIAANAADGFLYIAVRDATSGLLRVLKYSVISGDYFDDTRFASAAIRGGPSVAIVDGDVYVAFQRGDGSGIDVLHAIAGSAPAESLLLADTSGSESEPTLAWGGSQLVLFSMIGPMETLPDPLTGEDIVSGSIPHSRVGYVLVRRSLRGASFDPLTAVQRLPLPFGYADAPASANQEPVGLPLMQRVAVTDSMILPPPPMGGAGAAFFAGRLHVLLDGVVEGEFVDTTFAHYSYHPGPDPVAEEASSSRFQGVEIGGGLGRPAVVVFNDGAIGEYLAVIATSPFDGSIGVRYRRSY